MPIQSGLATSRASPDPAETSLVWPCFRRSSALRASNYCTLSSLQLLGSPFSGIPALRPPSLGSKRWRSRRGSSAYSCSRSERELPESWRAPSRPWLEAGRKLCSCSALHPSSLRDSASPSWPLRPGCRQWSKEGPLWRPGADQLLPQPRRYLAARCRLRGQDPQRGEAGRPSGGASYEAPARDQPENGQSARTHHPTVGAGTGGPVDRVARTRPARSFIENVGYLGRSLTDKQIESVEDVFAWLHGSYPTVPLQLAQSFRDSRLAYHSLDPNLDRTPHADTRSHRTSPQLAPRQLARPSCIVSTRRACSSVG